MSQGTINQHVIDNNYMLTNNNINASGLKKINITFN
jgi:hypothetical protein